MQTELCVDEPKNSMNSHDRIGRVSTEDEPHSQLFTLGSGHETHRPSVHHPSSTRSTDVIELLKLPRSITNVHDITK